MGLEEATGKYDMVTCIDVMIHYPKDRVDGMINHLASLSSKKLIISFAPKTLAYLILKRVGELFPGPSKATRAYLHDEADVEICAQGCRFQGEAPRNDRDVLLLLPPSRMRARLI